MKSFRYYVRGAARAFILPALLILGACTANTSSTDDSGLLPHLAVDLQLPAELSPGSAGQFRIAVTMGGEPVDAADAMFEFWPEGHPEQRIEVAASSVGHGVYAAEHRLEGEGIYVVRSRVASDALEVMPTKRIALGRESAQRLAELERQLADDAPAAQDGGGHHH